MALRGKRLFMVSLMMSLPALGLRLPRNESKPTTDGGDCYTRYEQKYLIGFSSCTPDIAKATNNATSQNHCACLGVMGEGSSSKDQCCTTAPVVCEKDFALKFLKEFGEHVTLISNDTAQYYREKSGKLGKFSKPNVSVPTFYDQKEFYKGWRDLASQEGRIADVVTNSKGLVKREVMGKSYENRDIWALRVTGEGYKKGDTKILLTFQVHAREWIAGMAGVYVAENIAAKLHKEPDWLKGTEIVLMPMCNPDGFVYSGSHDRMWRKNTHAYNEPMETRASMGTCMGVDLNRNFATDWGGLGSTSMNHCSDVYIGEKAESEPETQAIIKAIDETHLTLHIDYHSYSEIFLAPWSYKTDPHPDRPLINDLMSRMSSGVRNNSGREYGVGGNELLYQASGIGPDYSTSKGAWGITMELSPKMDFLDGGFLLPQEKILSTAKDAWETVLAAVAYLKETQRK